MPTKAYILIRTELNLCKAPNWRNKQRWMYLHQCLESALLQSYDNFHIVILQSGKGCSTTPKLVNKLPKALQKVVTSIIGKGVAPISLYRTKHKGAGCAQYLIREAALALAKDDEILIQLDDDDYFADNCVVEEIAKKFTKGIDICITSYNIVGDKSQDITNQAGSVHNQLLRGDYKEMSLAYADSLGWTKSYRAKALKDYHNRLSEAESDIIAYFKKNRAFEDFMDIIAISGNRSGIALLDKKTHCYRKHALSITAKTDKEQFKQRANALALSVRMSQGASDEGKALVAKFCIVKILLIENILSKFRKERRNRWINKTTNGYFFELFVKTLRESNLLGYFADIAEGKSSAKNGIKFTTPEEKIEKACEREARLGMVDVSNCFITTSIKQKDARKQAYRADKIFSCVIIAVATIAMVVAITIAIYGKVSVNVIALITPFLIAIISFFFNRIVSLKKKEAEEEAKIDIYHEEIKELTRHLLANLNILKGLDEKIEQNGIKGVGEIHFTNIKLPAESILLSNDPIQNSLCDDLNNIARLKVNIRNINNSADYLKHIATKENFDKEELHRAIQWELVRYVGLLAQLRFFEENRNFKMPSIEQLKIYVKVRHINEYIASELAPKYKGKFDEIIKNRANNSDYLYIERYMNKFYEDREVTRDLLIFK